MRFTQKVAVVTGANSGIGRATAIRLLEEDATVVAVDLEHTQAWPERYEARVDQLTLDVAAPETPDLVGAHLRKEHGHVDVLANIAGILRIAPFLEATRADWDRVVAVNLTASDEACYTTGACLDVDGGYSMDGSLPGTAYSAD